MIKEFLNWQISYNEGEVKQREWGIILLFGWAFLSWTESEFLDEKVLGEIAGQSEQVNALWTKHVIK